MFRRDTFGVAQSPKASTAEQWYGSRPATDGKRILKFFFQITSFPFRASDCPACHHRYSHPRTTLFRKLPLFHN